MPKLNYLVLVLALIVQVFWTGVAHGCQRDLLPALAHCGVCSASVSALDRGDSSDDSAGGDACPACHMVSLQVDFAIEESAVTIDRNAPVAHAQPSHLSHLADGPERPKWEPAA